jgi:hypothetical protein
MAEQQTEHQIGWRHDFDQALSDAKSRSRVLLLDFSAAPM